MELAKSTPISKNQMELSKKTKIEQVKTVPKTV